MLYFKFFLMTLNYKNEETLYVIFSYVLDFFLYIIFWIFLNDFKLQKCMFSLSIRLKALKWRVSIWRLIWNLSKPYGR